MARPPATLELLEALAEPTRLRLVNCLAAAPLFVTDLQVILGIPQPTVSRHLKVLRESGLVRDTPIAQYVLYRLRRPSDGRARVLTAVLEAALQDAGLRQERAAAVERSRKHTGTRVDASSEATTP